ncbi:MAG: Riboflavin synthase, alpha subunit [Parcubacteria group bacterium GW2011_GWA2_44_12]|nr:MAG: Riboflavin synthase, alpha subunit [Parcubacteria group bacterium GW2011_GWA2_44_12]
MFTGIIQKTGIIKAKTGKALTIQTPFKSLKKSMSIAINGVCLTITKNAGGCVSMNVIPETLRVTTLGNLQKGSKVNLELPLRYNEFVGGHIVQGHIDTTGKIQEITQAGNDTIYRIEVSQNWNTHIVQKGSIAVDGVSLTVSKAGNNFFEVAITPYTFEHTLFQKYTKGTLVNIEFDVMGKYILNYAQKFYAQHIERIERRFFKNKNCHCTGAL